MLCISPSNPYSVPPSSQHGSDVSLASTLVEEDGALNTSAPSDKCHPSDPEEKTGEDEIYVGKPFYREWSIDGRQRAVEDIRGAFEKALVGGYFDKYPTSGLRHFARDTAAKVSSTMKGDRPTATDKEKALNHITRLDKHVNEQVMNQSVRFYAPHNSALGGSNTQPRRFPLESKVGDLRNKSQKWVKWTDFDVSLTPDQQRRWKDIQSLAPDEFGIRRSLPESRDGYSFQLESGKLNFKLRKDDEDGR